MNLKNILKAIKINESTISMVLGALVIIIAGILVVNYFKDKNTVGMIPEEIQENMTEETPKVGEVYSVQEGDNLWIVAEKTYGSGYNWVDIAAANNISNPNVLWEGQELSIPNVEPKLATVNLISDTDANEISQATYEVSQGDSLWTIAQRAYGDGMKWVEIAEANNLSNPDLIHKGNILTIPR